MERAISDLEPLNSPYSVEIRIGVAHSDGVIDGALADAAYTGTTVGPVLSALGASRVLVEGWR